jgi:hypothetical protein
LTTVKLVTVLFTALKITDTSLSAYYIHPQYPPFGTATVFNTCDWTEHQ